MTTPTTSGRFRSLEDPETLRLFARSLGEGIYIADPDGKLLDANASFLRIVGATSVAELEEFHVPRRYKNPERRLVWLETIAREGSVREFEWELIRPDAQVRTVLETSYLVVDPDSGERFHHGILVDITERRAFENQLREQLVRDALTGCFNRRFLIDLQAKLQEDREDRWGCIFLDIDHFKYYNDRYGHSSGDLALRKMARFLMREVRSEEPVVRMGGDEFLIVITGENATGTEEVAHRLQHAAARSAPAPFSLGWAIREDGESFEKTVDRADRKLIGVRVLHRSGEHARLPDEMERRKG